MLFNSFVFVGFFVATYGLYLALARLPRAAHRAQNLLLLLASYVFYGYWDVRFLGLIALSTLIDFQVGRRLATTEDPRRRRFLVSVSLVSNLSILGSFKYFNFFRDSFAELLETVGMRADLPTLAIVLPVGISFYTFQTLSYTIDIYRRRLEPTHDPIGFALFVAFFPQLVAGPIERATNLLPQIAAPRRLVASQVDAGLFLILWGYFKKVVVADNLAMVADRIFDPTASHQGLDLWIGVLAFAMQIYCDFSGYSDIARGLAKLLGFELMVNFRLPYFARSPSDFWRRWHISLSSWLRDYLYIPLGGNRDGRLRTYRNLFLTMLLGGLWHGAAWTFVLWGAYHGAILILYRAAAGWRILGERGMAFFESLPGRLLRMGWMFLLTLVGWVIFRAESVGQVGQILAGAMQLTTSSRSLSLGYQLVFFAMPVVGMQLIQHRTGDLLVAARMPTWARAPLYGLLLVVIVIFGVRDSNEFIYFQF